MGASDGESGTTSLIRRRMSLSANGLTPEQLLCTLQIDEMHIKSNATLNRTHDRIIGLAENLPESQSPAILANKMLGFYITGLSKSYKFPVAFFFVQAITAEQLFTYTMKTLKGKEYFFFIPVDQDSLLKVLKKVDSGFCVS